MTDGHRRLAGDLALGFVAGAAATWVMDKVTTVLYARESNEAKERENAGGLIPSTVSAPSSIASQKTAPCAALP